MNITYFNFFNILLSNFHKIKNKSEFESFISKENIKEIPEKDYHSVLKKIKNSFYKKANIYAYSFKTIENKNEDNEIALYFYKNRLMQMFVQLYYDNKNDAEKELKNIIKLIKEISFVDFTYEEPKSYNYIAP